MLEVRYQGGNIDASLIPDPLHSGQWISHQEVHGRPFSFGKRDPFPIHLPELQDRELLPDDTPDIQLVTPAPNPFSDHTVVGFETQGGQVSLTVYSLLGQPVRHLWNRHLSRGYYEQVWDGKDDLGKTVSSGVYFVQIHSQSKKMTRRVIFLR